MFTKKDFEDYFEEINLLEKETLRLQMETLTKITNPEVRTAIMHVVNDEVRHVKMTEQLTALLQNSKI